MAFKGTTRRDQLTKKDQEDIKTLVGLGMSIPEVMKKYNLKHHESVYRILRKSEVISHKASD